MLEAVNTLAWLKSTTLAAIYHVTCEGLASARKLTGSRQLIPFAPPIMTALEVTTNNMQVAVSLRNVILA